MDMEGYHGGMVTALRDPPSVGSRAMAGDVIGGLRTTSIVGGESGEVARRQSGSSNRFLFWHSLSIPCD